MKALRLGLNVMLFSDNVALADEIEPRPTPASTTSWSWGRTAALRSSPASRSASPTRVRRRHRRGRVRHRAAAGDLPDRPLGPGHLAGDRHRRPIRSPRRGRRHHHAAGPGCSGGRSRHPGRGADLETARSGDRRTGPRRGRGRGQAGSWSTSSAPIRARCGARTSTRCAPSRTRRASRWLCPAVPGSEAAETLAARASAEVSAATAVWRRGRDTSAGSTAAAPSATRRCSS